MGVTRIQHNLSAMNAMSNYQGNQNTLTGNLEKLSSGYRINSAADDAAGLAISEKMRSQIAGLEKAQDNANDGISLVQTAEGALTEVNSMLTRLKTLATQSANGTYEDGVDRANLQEETDALLSEIDRISQSTNFNGINLLDGSMSSSGIKQTDVAVNINGITMNSTASTEGKSTSYAVELSQAAGINEGDKQVYKFSFTDEQGTSKTASISFGAGSDQASTTKNMADAINKDSIMGAHFTAHVDKNNKLIIDSNITAFAADGKDITKGAASIQDISATSGGIGIASQEAVESVNVNVEQLYDKDGFKVNADAESVKAAQAKGDLYTSGPNITKKAEIDSNGVQSSGGVTLSDEGKAITTDTTFTMTKKSKISDDSSVSGAELTEAGEKLASGTATSTIAKFEFQKAKIDAGGWNTAISAGTLSVKAYSAAENLTEDAVIKYNAAKADNDSGTIQSGATTIREDTTFKFNVAKVDTGVTSNDLGTVNLTEKSELLTELGKITKKDGTSFEIDNSATSVSFTFTAASVDTTAASTITANSATATADEKSFTVTSAMLTKKATGLTEDATLTYANNKWTVNGKTVEISDYLNTTGMNALNKLADGVAEGSKFTIKGGNWTASDGTNSGVVDATKYFDTSDQAYQTGQKVTIELGTWQMSTEANTAGTVVSAQDMDSKYFSGVNIDKNTTINVTAGYWTSSDSSLGDNGVIKDKDLKNYIDGYSGTTAASLQGGEVINIKAGHWLAKDKSGGTVTSVGDSGKVGDGSAYFTGATATSGATVILEKTADWSVKSEDKSLGDENGKVEDITKYLKGLNNIDNLNEGDIVVKAAEFTMNEDDKAVEGTDYELTDGVTQSKTYDLTSLNDGDRVQINGTNYTYRANEEDVKASTDFNTGSQLAGMSQAISFKADGGNDLSAVTVKTEFAEGESLTLQVGDTAKDYQKVNVDIKDMSSTGLGLKGLDISTQEKAAEAIDTIQTAVNAVSTQRGKLGALQNRLDHTLNNLDATTQNITAAESQIRDVDMAKEMTQYSKNNILVQAAQSMLAQANSLPQGVLSLLQ